MGGNYHPNGTSLPSVVSELQKPDLVCSVLGYVGHGHFRRLVRTTVIDYDYLIGKLRFLRLGGNEGGGGGREGRR